MQTMTSTKLKYWEEVTFSNKYEINITVSKKKIIVPSYITAYMLACFQRLWKRLRYSQLNIFGNPLKNAFCFFFFVVFGILTVYYEENTHTNTHERTHTSRHERGEKSKRFATGAVLNFQYILLIYTATGLYTMQVWILDDITQTKIRDNQIKTATYNLWIFVFINNIKTQQVCIQTLNYSMKSPQMYTIKLSL